MTRAGTVLSHRYAQAYLLACGEDYSFEDIERIKQVGLFLQEHDKVLYFLSLPTFAKKRKKELMQELFAQLELSGCFDDLISLLVEQSRIELIAQIMLDVVQLYLQKNDIMEFSIESSSVLNQEQLKIIKQFLAYNTGKNIVYTYRENKNLIAGIRLQSDLFVWEYSVRKKLRAISLSLIR